MTITISVPGAVYDDALDPLCSSMAEEIGLPPVKLKKRAKGFSAIYENVTAEQAEQTAEYISDRGEMLLGEGVQDPYDPDEARARAALRAAIKAASKIREQIRKEC